MREIHAGRVSKEVAGASSALLCGEIRRHFVEKFEPSGWKSVDLRAGTRLPYRRVKDVLDHGKFAAGIDKGDRLLA